jgi:hypothetical protein
MKYKYIRVESTYKIDTCERKSYGIAICDGEQNVLETIADISSDVAAIESLVSLCNKESLSPCHLHDVVRDFLITS